MPAKCLDPNTLPQLGNRVPEKWEGLATQNGSGVQFDVYFDFAAALADPAYDAYVNSIQCPIGKKTNCFYTPDGGPAMLTQDHELLPGVLHSYKVPLADLGLYVAPAQP